MDRTDIKSASIVKEKNSKQSWVCCPFCGKKAFPISNGAIIINQEFLCRGSNCKKIFLVNVGVKND